MSDLPVQPDFLSDQVRESDCFFLDLNPDPDREFAVVCGGLEYCRDDYCVERSRFRYHGLEYIVSGQCRLRLGERRFELHAGGIFSYDNQTSHRMESSGTGELVKFFVDFTGTQVEQILGMPLTGGTAPRQMPNLRNMHALFRLLVETGKDGGSDVQETLALILNLIGRQVVKKAVAQDEYQSRAYQTYRQCMAHLSANYRSLSSAESLASACHLSPGHLARLFRKYGQESPYRSLLRLRMARAGELLRRRDLLIKEVADEAGYEDPYHFSRLFKQCHGVSPEKFRESLPTQRFE